MKFPKKVDIDVSKDLYNPIQVKQSDNARYLLFRILDNGVPFSLENKTVRFFGKKPDGKEIYNDIPVTNAAKGECELRLTSGALSTPGILQLEIEIKENEDILTTFLLDVDIKKSLRSSSSIESSNEYTIIEKIIEKIIKKVDEAIKKIPGKEELIPSIGSNGNWFIGGNDTGVGTSGVIFEIKQNTDLDSVKKPGYYKCTDPDIVSTLENCPTDNSFTLFVEDLKQTLSETVASAGAKTWSRSYRNGMWGFWDKNFSEFCRPKSDEIIVSAERQFVSNVEKTSWNNKISKDDYEVGSNGICKTLDSRNDIRLITKSGKYSGVNVTGNPTGTDAFYFYDVECMSSDVRIVTAKTADSPLRIFVGSYISEWLGWKEVFNVDRKPTPAEIGASSIGHNHFNCGIIDNKDLNDYTSEGLQGVTNNNCTNQPASGYFYIFNMKYNNTNIKQIAYGYNQYQMYYRHRLSGIWSPWCMVYNSDNKPTLDDIGASPSGHNHDDRYYTEAEMNEKLKTKVSVESGKGLSTNDYTTAEKNKLSGIAAEANAYVHPSSHPATMITEDSTHRFVTDVEKSTWNNKAPGDYGVGGTAKRLDPNSRLDEIKKSGFYTVSEAPDKPTWCTHSWVYCLHINHDAKQGNDVQSKWCTQLVWSFDNPSKMWIRTKTEQSGTGSIWNNWSPLGDVSTEFFGFDKGMPKMLTSGSILDESLPIGYYSAYSPTVAGLPDDGMWIVMVLNYRDNDWSYGTYGCRNRVLLAFSPAMGVPNMYIRNMMADGSSWTDWSKVLGPPVAKLPTLASGATQISGKLNSVVVEGNLVTVDVTVSGTFSGGGIIATGLPKPRNGMQVSGILAFETSGAPYSVYIDANGNLKNSSGNVSKSGCWMHTTYVKDAYS